MFIHILEIDQQKERSLICEQTPPDQNRSSKNFLP